MNEREIIVNRKISTCIISFILLLFLAYACILLWQRGNEPPAALTRERKKEEEPVRESQETLPSSKTEEPYLYIMFERDGMLTVYAKDGRTVYLDTGISVKYLPTEIRQRLWEGIRIYSEKELYDFLESYSS